MRVLCLATCICLALASFTSCSKETTSAQGNKQISLSKPSDQSVKRGSSTQVTVKIDRKNFRDPVKVTFEGLPSGVKVTDADKMIAAEDESATFTLAADLQAPLVVDHVVELIVVDKGKPSLESRQSFKLDVKE